MYIGGLGIAKDRWDSFSDTTKAAFLAGAKAYAAGFFKEQHARYEAAKKTLTDKGGQIVVMDPAERSAWIGEMANPAAACKKAAEARGEPADAVLSAYRDTLSKSGFTFTRDYLGQ
jgi:TRAP-type C4-dicarboxylate transport system substrate-binding protein